MSQQRPQRSGEEAPASSGFGPAVGAIFAIILVGSMITLVVVLGRTSGDGRKAIEAYVSSIKAGASVSETVAGVEVETVTKALRETGSVSVSNFQSQQDTSCFWVKLARAGGDVEARVVLAERSSAVEVTAISLTRACECPHDHAQPCRLR